VRRGGLARRTQQELARTRRQPAHRSPPTPSLSINHAPFSAPWRQIPQKVAGFAGSLPRTAPIAVAETCGGEDFGAFIALPVPAEDLPCVVERGTLQVPARRIGQRWRATRAPQPAVYSGGPGSVPGLSPSLRWYLKSEKRDFQHTESAGATRGKDESQARCFTLWNAGLGRDELRH
jgi:hypothetical protein